MIGKIFLNSCIRKLPKYSYGRYLIENKKTSHEERKKALKNFLDMVYGKPIKKCDLV